MAMRILALSDQVVEQIYSPRVPELFGKVDLVLGCGDLPDYYLEFVVSMLNVPFFHVPGNHDRPSAARDHADPSDGDGDPLSNNLDGRIVRESGLLLAGLGGSIRYRPDGVNQYTQAEMGWRIAALTPRLLWHRFRHGHPPDILLAHAPPLGVHDGNDPAHVGFSAFHRFIRLFRPRYLLHGHSHVWRRDTVVTTQVGPTLVLNVCPFRVLDLECRHAR
jgi:uncharacterized protein